MIDPEEGCLATVQCLVRYETCRSK